MGQLSGKTTRVSLTELEVVADDQRHVLAFSRTSDGTVYMKLRDANEHAYSSTTITEMTLTERDARILGFVIGGGDAKYSMSLLDEVKDQRFQLPQPIKEPSGLDADCTPLDVERAKAANIKEERELVKEQLRLDHSRDKHIYADVQGCPDCEAKVIPSVMPPTEEESDTADTELPDDDMSSYKGAAERLASDPEADDIPF